MVSAPDSKGVKFWMNSYKAHMLESSNYLNRFDYIRRNIIVFCNLLGIKLLEVTTDQYTAHFNSEYYINARMWMVPWIREWPIMLKGQELLEFQNQYFARDIAPNNNKILDLLKYSDDLVGFAHPGIAYQDEVVNKFFRTLDI